MVAIGPGGAVVIEDAIGRIRPWMESKIVQSEVAVDEDAILCVDLHGLIAFNDILHRTHECGIIDHEGKPLAYPGARFGPVDPRPQPAVDIRRVNPHVLLRQDAAERATDVLGQDRLGFAAFEQAPWVATSGTERRTSKLVSDV